MRISDWSSDVCSSDLLVVDARMRCKIGGNIGTEHADIGHLPSVRRVAAGVPMLDLPPALVEIGLEHGKAARLGDLVGREEAHAILVEDRKSTRLNSRH